MALGVVGYFAALLTAFYSFRMVFRVFFGPPVPEARELEQGHLAHGEHANPMTGEEEDTDVGFPGSEHHIAEREWPMRAAMAPLALLAITAGALGIPGVTDTFEHFLEPTFEDSTLAHEHPSDGRGVDRARGRRHRRDRRDLRRVDLVHAPPGPAAGVARAASRACMRFLANKWYFDEVFDAAIVRPVGAAGRFGRTVVESRVRAGRAGGRHGRAGARGHVVRALDPDR